MDSDAGLEQIRVKEKNKARQKEVTHRKEPEGD